MRGRLYLPLLIFVAALALYTATLAPGLLPSRRWPISWKLNSFADYSIWAVIRYLQVVEGARPDVELVQLSGDQVSLVLRYQNRPHLFLADVYRYYDVEGIRQHFDILPYGPVYQLIPVQNAHERPRHP